MDLYIYYIQCTVCTVFHFHLFHMFENAESTTMTTGNRKVPLLMLQKPKVVVVVNCTDHIQFIKTDWYGERFRS